MDITRLGPYRIDRKLGRGGMGIVYAGVHVETGEPAAVKVVSPGMSGETNFHDRFVAEIESLKRLRHPNIVQLFGYGEQDGYLFYAMELVDGCSLQEELQNGRRFGWREVARIGVEVCRALRHAHDRGIIHRDLKPANLLLGKDDSVKLADFGIARLFGYSHLTAEGGPLGTADYMAPEQAEGRPLSPRCDLYSLGSVLFALLSGRPPFWSKSLPEVIHMVRFDPAPLVGRRVAGVPDELERLIDQLLAKEPEERIATASAVANRLEAMLHALSLSPDEQSGVERLSDDTTDESYSLSEEPLDSNAAQEIASAATRELPPLEELEAEEPARTEVPVARRPTAGPVMTDPDLGGGESNSTGNGRKSGANSFTVVNEVEEAVLPPAEPAGRSLRWIGTLLLIAALAGFFWVATRPPSADQLFARIDRAADSTNPHALLNIESDLVRFIERFPQDERADQVRQYQERLEVGRLERRLQRLERTGVAADDLLPAERIYLSALQSASHAPETAVAQLAALIALFGEDDQADSRQQLVVQLARSEQARLQASIDRTRQQTLPLLLERIKQGEAMAATNPDAARELLSSLITLYKDKTWATPAVQQALASYQAIPSPDPTDDAEETDLDPPPTELEETPEVIMD